MYKNHLKVKPTNTGKGIFTEIDILPNMPIIEVTGAIHKAENMPDPNNSAWLQVSNRLFIGASGSYDDQIRHSCNPNCYVRAIGSRAIVYSLYLIKADSEITFDYSLTSTDTLDSWQMNCQCGQFNCRKIISGFQYLGEDLKEKYRKMGIVPMFMENPMFYGQ